jgi:hypothetical protein
VHVKRLRIVERSLHDLDSYVQLAIPDHNNGPDQIRTEQNTVVEDKDTDTARGYDGTRYVVAE